MQVCAGFGMCLGCVLQENHTDSFMQERLHRVLFQKAGVLLHAGLRVLGKQPP
jgi:hypothetical protein